MIAIGQYFLKLSTNESGELTILITNWHLWLGLILYGVGAIFLVLALRKLNVSTAYPMMSLSYIWVLIIAVIYFEEIVSFWNILGMLFIISGIIVLGGKNE
ncbi:EamA family transporter [Candidatus Woesearchaeota archaeon]|nr:EamA family transporter [Candidatus Woesearchaeota archaeon]